MATVTAYTAARMKAIEDNSVIDGEVVGDNLVLTKFNGSQINAGNVRGPVGPIGPAVASAELVPITNAQSRFVSDNVEDALHEVMDPVGTFIMGGWSTDPQGYLILDGRRIVGGAATYLALGQEYPGWVDVNDLVLPNSAGAVPLAVGVATTPGVVSGSMTHTLSVAQLPAHTHAGPSHSHSGPSHSHSGPSHTHSFAGSTSDVGNHAHTYERSYGQAGSQALLGTGGQFHIGNSSTSTGAAGGHGHTFSGNTGSASGTTGTASGTTGTASGTTGSTGSGNSIDHTPKNITIRLAVKY